MAKSYFRYENESWNDFHLFHVHFHCGITKEEAEEENEEKLQRKMEMLKEMNTNNITANKTT